jgi:hypothetical protein
MELIAGASGDNPARLPAALLSSGVVLSATALSLIVFKALGGSFLRLHTRLAAPSARLLLLRRPRRRCDLRSRGGVVRLLGGAEGPG